MTEQPDKADSKRAGQQERKEDVPASIPVVDASKTSAVEFVRSFELDHRPCLIRGLTDNWVAMKTDSAQSWSRESLLGRFGNEPFDIGTKKHSYQTLREFVQYADSTKEDSPRYVFEGKYGERYPALLKDYSVPAVFADDYMSYLAGGGGSGSSALLPYYRWFLVGGPRSGFTMHQDPNETSAWNALVVGVKRWVMLPPSTPAALVAVPKAAGAATAASVSAAAGAAASSSGGVEAKAPAASGDDSATGEVDSDGDDADDKYEGSAFEWFRDVYPKVRFWFASGLGFPIDCSGVSQLKPRATELGMLECVQRPGETMFVPHNW
jgi:hypothetical protein